MISHALALTEPQPRATKLIVRPRYIAIVYIPLHELYLNPINPSTVARNLILLFFLSLRRGEVPIEPPSLVRVRFN